MASRFPHIPQIEGAEAPTAESLLADAWERHELGHTVEGVVLGYLALRTAAPDTEARTHLFISEAVGELGYRALERIHARAAMRAQEAAPDSKLSAGPFHSRLGVVSLSTGDHAVAEYHFQRAKEAAEARQPRDTSVLASAILDLVRLSLSRANVDSPLDAGNVDHLADAAQRLEQAIAIIENDQAVDAWMWTEVNELQVQMLVRGGDQLPPEHQQLRDQMLQTAEQNLRTIVEQRQLLRPLDVQSLVPPMTALAGVLRRTGRLVDASEVNEELLDITDQLQRIDAGVVMSMTLLAAEFGNAAPLVDFCDAVMSNEEARVAELASMSGEAVALSSSARMRRRSMKCLALLGRAAASDGGSARKMLDIALRRKAVVADAEEVFWRTVYRHRSPDVDLARGRLVALRNRLGEQVVHGRGHGLWRLVDAIQTGEEYLSVQPWWEDFGTDPAMAPQRDALEGYANALVGGASPWEALADKGGVFDEAQVNVETVARHLRAGSVLVEFVRVEGYDLDRDLLLPGGRYWAFVLDPSGRVVARDLGDATELEADTASQLGVLHDGDPLHHEPQLAAMAELYDRLWEPIAADVAAASSVILSPDAALGVVPFACLLAPDGRFLVESTTLFHVATGRQLAEEVTDEVDDPGPPVVVADPDYDALPLDARAAAAEVNGTPPTRFEFGRLAEGANEAAIVCELLGPEAVMLTRRDASEAAVRALHRPTVLHLATHGVFDRTVAIDGAGLDSDDALAVDTTYVEHVRTLCRSGIALAGVNSAHSALDGGGDGFLTAFDVGGMNLSGTDLVALTACDSGRGTLLAGEGVLGMARSFRIAGARHVMMSLWRLSDREAKRQMRTFYTKYTKGDHPTIALRDTHRARIERLRTALGHHPPPALWGALTVRGI